MWPKIMIFVWILNISVGQQYNYYVQYVFCIVSIFSNIILGIVIYLISILYQKVSNLINTKTIFGANTIFGLPINIYFNM